MKRGTSKNGTWNLGFKCVFYTRKACYTAEWCLTNVWYTTNPELKKLPEYKKVPSQASDSLVVTKMWGVPTLLYCHRSTTGFVAYIVVWCGNETITEQHLGNGMKVRCAFRYITPRAVLQLGLGNWQVNFLVNFINASISRSPSQASCLQL